MRTTVLVVALIVGCAKPQPVEVPAVAIAPPVAAPVEVAPAPREIDGSVPRHVPQDAENLAQLSRMRKCDPCIARDLATGRFNYGGKLDDVTAVYKPDAVFHHGEFMTVVFSGGSYISSRGHTFVIVRNGRLVRSFGDSCVVHAVYFDGLTEAERMKWREGYEKAHKVYVDAHIRNRERGLAGMTVAGPVAAVVHRCEP